MNSWSITGNLGNDPRVNATQSGESVLNLSVAVRRRQKRNGEWVDVPLWVGVTMFGKRVDGLSRILRKGMRVGCTGEVNLREYTDRNGVARTALELLARDIEPLEASQHQGGERSQQHFGGPRGADSADQTGGALWNAEDYDDDIPF